MTRNHRLGLIAAFTILAAISLPQSCNAGSLFQPPPILVEGVGSLFVGESTLGGTGSSSFSSNDPAYLYLTYFPLSSGWTLSLFIFPPPLAPPPYLPFPYLIADGTSTYQQFEDLDLSRLPPPVWMRLPLMSSRPAMTASSPT